MTGHYKLLDDGQKSGHGGSGVWVPGEWRTVTGPIVPCQNGFHFVTANNLLAWTHKECWLFEDGSPDETIVHDDKLVTRKGRITVRVDGWNDRNLRLFAADCAERVLPLFEEKFPNDDRPREALVAARKFANGEISCKELAAAGDAAWAAAGAAAGDAAGTAAGAAAGTAAGAAGDAAGAAGAAGDAAWDAAGAAAWAAEREWQTARLVDYMEGRA